MEDSLVGKIAAVRQAADMGCFGAHQISNGDWLPCSSTKQFLTIMNGFDVKSRISLDEMENWSSIRKSKGKKRKKRWEKLRERRVLGIESLDNGGLVSPSNSMNMVNGGTNPPITYGASVSPGMSTKSIQPAFMPRDNDPDVFVDIESARKRAQQLGCIGISRRMSKGGKTVWMPCTNITDYNNLTGMTALGRNNLQKRNEKIVRTVIKENLKKKKTTIQEDIYGKALGPRIRGIARAAMSRFDPDAFDGDEDGIIQDGTTFERPNTPNARIPKTVDRAFSPSEVSAVRKWMGSMTSSQMDSFRGEPIEAYDGVPGSRRGMASSGPGFIIDPKGPKQMGARMAPKPLAITELRNPEASPTNPFRNLGGRLMSKLIRGMVKPEHRGKQDRTTFLIGGNTGSGKTTVLDEHLIPKGLVPSHEEAALIDPDFIKKGLVGYDDGEGAGRVHRESQASTDKTIGDAVLDEMDMVITGSGASRQIQHMREASKRGEKVVGHWVHVPQQEASRRIKKRRDETNRYIPDNTAHMAQSIPKVISTGFEEDLLDEFYLWDNDVPEGSPPKLIAKKLKGKDFEIFDQSKFEEFAGSKKWADTWVETSADRDVSRGGFSSYSGAEALVALKKMGFEIFDGEKIFISFPKGTPIEKFFEEKVKKFLLKGQTGRFSSHKSIKKGDGEVIPRTLLSILGIDIDLRKLIDKRYIKEFKELMASDKPEVLEKLFAEAPIKGPNGESRFKDLISSDAGVEVEIKETLEDIAKRIGVSESQISRLISEGITEDDIKKMSKEEIEEYSDMIGEGFKSSTKPFDPFKFKAQDLIDLLNEDPSMYDLSPEKIPEIIFKLAGGDAEWFGRTRIRNIKPKGKRTEQQIMDLVSQIRIETSPDGIFTVIAPPIPEFRDLIGFDGDFSNVRIPSPEARLRMYQSILDNLSPTKKNDEGSDSVSYSEDLGKKLKDAADDFFTVSRQDYSDLLESLGGEYMEGTPDDSFDAIYERFLRMPTDFIFLKEMYQSDYIQVMHDVVGHLGTGRGFDRHGEWANFLAMVHAGNNTYRENPEYLDHLPFDLFKRIMIAQLENWEAADERRGISSAKARQMLEDLRDISDDQYVDGETMRRIIQLDNPDTYRGNKTKSLTKDKEVIKKRAVAYIHSFIDNNMTKTGTAHSSFVKNSKKNRRKNNK